MFRAFGLRITQLRPRLNARPYTAGLGVLIWAICLGQTAQPEVTAAPVAPLSDYDPATDTALYLLVSINGRTVGLIAEFALSQQSLRMSAQRIALEQIGIAAPQDLGAHVFLDEIPDFAFVYDAPSQTMSITAQGATLIPVEISARSQTHQPAAQSGLGVLLNYRATTFLSDGPRPRRAFVALDLRAYAPIGVLTSTGALDFAFDDGGAATFTRHDTFFTMSRPATMITLTAGDFATSGLAWTRPVRLGGLEIRRDFSLRDDVVSSPLLSFSGTAALPSSIDVYVDNIRAYSGSVAAGRFNLSDVPMITAGGEAVFVLRDESGHEQTTKVPFFATPTLLAAGTVDFVIAAGKARDNYAMARTSYGAQTARTISLRYGLSDRLTLGAHAEALGDLRMGGLGVDMALFNRAEVTIAGGASVDGSAQGQFFFGALRTQIGAIGLRFSTRRSYADFRDLASAAYPSGGLAAGHTAQDMLSLAFPMLANHATMGVSIVHAQSAERANTIVQASYAQPLPWGAASFRVNGFHDLAGDGGSGVSFGISMPLGANGYANATLQRDHSGQMNTTASLSRIAGQHAGSFGYRADLAAQSSDLGATYQTAYGRADLALRDNAQGRRATATFEGALVVSGGGLFAGNRIKDSFAVVDVGLPDIAVSLNNREVARTAASGKALLSDLQSYRINRISVDPLDLPLDAILDATAIRVVPTRRAGVVIDLRGRNRAAALVVIRDAAGDFLAPGTVIALTGSQQDFRVGYDGEVWIEGLGAHNRISAQIGPAICQAAFPFAAQAGVQVYIQGVTCR
jgi:outer membrane usher protein